jgi:hypothetical protein
MRSILIDTLEPLESFITWQLRLLGILRSFNDSKLLAMALHYRGITLPDGAHGIS